MYKYDEEKKKIDFSHNPFSMPQISQENFEKRDPLSILAYQYDLVCNGFEISSGAIRNHLPELMYKVAELDSKSIEDKVMNLLNSNIVLQKQKQ